MRSIDAALVPVSGTWARYRAVPRRPAGGIPAPGRWQRIGTPRHYLADTERTAWAEFYRALAERGQAPQDQLPCELISVAVALDRVADPRTGRARAMLGLPRLRPTRSQVRCRFRTRGLALVRASPGDGHSS